MNKLVLSVALMLVVVASGRADDQERYGRISVQKVQGDVSVRHGVAEDWTSVKTGDILKPNDTIVVP